jgi:hypothetical protein
MEAAVRSNRLDVCVPAEGQSTCGEPPAEDRVRTPPRPPTEEDEEAPLPEEPIHIPPAQASSPAEMQPSGPGALLPSSMPSAFPAMPFVGPTLPKPHVIHSTKPPKRRVVQQYRRIRCTRVRRRRVAGSRRASRKCAIARAPHLKPRRRRHGHARS